MKTEPLVTVASFTTAVIAVLALVTEFGLSLTDGQQAAIYGVALVVAPFVVTAFARPHVTPTKENLMKIRNDRGAIGVVELCVVVFLVLVILFLFFGFGRADAREKEVVRADVPSARSWR